MAGCNKAERIFLTNLRRQNCFDRLVPVVQSFPQDHQVPKYILNVNSRLGTLVDIDCGHAERWQGQGDGGSRGRLNPGCYRPYD